MLHESVIEYRLETEAGKLANSDIFELVPKAHINRLEEENMSGKTKECFPSYGLCIAITEKALLGRDISCST